MIFWHFELVPHWVLVTLCCALLQWQINSWLLTLCRYGCPSRIAVALVKLALLRALRPAPERVHCTLYRCATAKGLGLMYSLNENLLHLPRNQLHRQCQT
jgi:hypothetical protein